MKHKLILASASKARLGVLKSAGITAKVLISDLNEEKILENLPQNIFHPDLQVTTLALAKALEIIKNIHLTTTSSTSDSNEKTDSPYSYNDEKLLVACDSMLEFEGKMLGKPKEAQIAIDRAKQMRGKTTILHTGHAVVKLEKESLISLKTSELVLPKINSYEELEEFTKNLPIKIVLNCDSTKVTFSHTLEDEIVDYVATKEPLYVAGGFTIDGYGSAFIERIDGDYNNVIGISPRVIRNCCIELGVKYTSIWD